MYCRCSTAKLFISIYGPGREKHLEIQRKYRFDAWIGAKIPILIVEKPWLFKILQLVSVFFLVESPCSKAWFVGFFVLKSTRLSKKYTICAKSNFVDCFEFPWLLVCWYANCCVLLRHHCWVFSTDIYGICIYIYICIYVYIYMCSIYDISLLGGYISRYMASIGIYWRICTYPRIYDI
jgi:hypothetical protein